MRVMWSEMREQVQEEGGGEMRREECESSARKRGSAKSITRFHRRDETTKDDINQSEDM